MALPRRQFVPLLALLLALAGTLAQGTETLPAVAPAEPVVPLDDFTSERGFFQRWQRNHEERAARDGYIETDRPSFTLASTTVPQGWIQLESGYTYAYSDHPWTYGTHAHYLPQLALRIGLTPRIELRGYWTGVGLSSDKYYMEDYRVYILSGVQNPQFGLKIQVTEQWGLLPQSALVTDLVVPTAETWNVMYGLSGSDTRVVPLVDYIYSWSIGEYVSLGGSTGSVFSNYDGVRWTEFFQSAILKFHWTPRFTAFMEWYGISNVYQDEIQPAQNVLDWGLKWRPRQNAQLDWRIGLPVDDDEFTEGVFTSVGFSFRY